jgi:exodeoxyribonuclease VII large subunit
LVAVSDFSTPSLWDTTDGTSNLEPTWSVGELSEVLQGALRQAFPDELWLRGEIRNLKRGSSGMVWFDLVEPPPGGGLGRQAVATLPIILFDTARRRVNAQLTGAGGSVRMEDGTEVRIRGRITYWPQGGRLQMQMTDIDPAFTLGRLAADRERLLRQLEAEGLLQRQQRLAFPLVPLRLGLVTSAGSAAEHDVLDELRRSAIGFRVVKADVRVQGKGAGRAVAWGLRTVAARGVDVVLLVRGGGSATDLAAFDSELIARAVAELDVPVVTGIGHDIDRSVADEVAHLSFKTPTASAQAMVAAVREFDAGLQGRWVAVSDAAKAVLSTYEARLRNCARHVALGTRHGLSAADVVLSRRAADLSRTANTALDRGARGLDRATSRIEGGARVHLRAHERRIDAATNQLKGRAPRTVEARTRELAAIETQLRAFDPVRTLARGWSITRTASGRLVRSADEVQAGDELVTTLATGEIASAVTRSQNDDE